MPRRRSMTARYLSGILLATAFVMPLGAAAHTHRAQEAPRILLDLPLRAVEYQLGRLTNEELMLVERKPEDVKYRPVYFAILIRRGMPPQYRDEALDALVKMDKASRARVLLDALAKVPSDDALTAEKLLGLLFAQPSAA